METFGLNLRKIWNGEYSTGKAFWLIQRTLYGQQHYGSTKKKRDDMNRSYLLIGELYVSVAFSVRYEIHLILCTIVSIKTILCLSEYARCDWSIY